MSFELAPKGWTPYDGQLQPINQNQVLFSLLGMDVSAASKIISRGNSPGERPSTRGG